MRRLQKQNYSIEIRDIPDLMLLFLDENGFNLPTSKKYGFSFIDCEAVLRVSKGRGVNISVLAFIYTKGVCFLKNKKSGFSVINISIFWYKLLRK